MRANMWLLALVIVALFSFWYTNTNGPLKEDEIARYLARHKVMGADEAVLERLRRFMSEDTGRQFFMVNILDMDENPPTVEGAAPGESADQLMGHYMEFMFPEMLSRASHPIFMGDAIFRVMDVMGIENAEIWDRAALMRYRSRRDLMEISTNPEFQGRHEFKAAALTKTIAYPVETTLYYSDPRLLLALVVIAAFGLLDIVLYKREKRMFF